eukprot:g17702.t1
MRKCQTDLRSPYAIAIPSGTVLSNLRDKFPCTLIRPLVRRSHISTFTLPPAWNFFCVFSFRIADLADTPENPIQSRKLDEDLSLTLCLRTGRTSEGLMRVRFKVIGGDEMAWRQAQRFGQPCAAGLAAPNWQTAPATSNHRSA